MIFVKKRKIVKLAISVIRRYARNVKTLHISPIDLVKIVVKYGVITMVYIQTIFALRNHDMVVVASINSIRCYMLTLSTYNLYIRFYKKRIKVRIMTRSYLLRRF